MPSPKFFAAAAFSAFLLMPATQAAGFGMLDRKFSKADINRNGTLDRTEFLSLQPRGKSWVDAMHRFNLADTDEDDGLSLIEFRASKGGKLGRKPSRSQAFVLADLDEDGFLDPEEFSRTMAQGKPWRKVLRDFGRKDRNDDALLSPQEFGIFLAVR